MRRILLLALLLALVPPPAAASGADVLVPIDVTDALDDSRAYPDVRLPHTDISRFTMSRDGDDVVQTVHVVGPWPENNYWVEVRNDFGIASSYTMKVEMMNSSGSNSRPTAYNTSHYSSVDPTSIGKKVNFTHERNETSITFRWPVDAIPAGAKCLTPQVTTLSRTTVNGRSTQVDDDLTVTPSLCTEGAISSGMDGTCGAPASPLVKASTIEDARGDVAERDNIDWKPYDNATLDILSLDTRIEDGWVIQTLKLAEASPRDRIQIVIDNQFTGNASQFEEGRSVTLSLMETDAYGQLSSPEGGSPIHVRASRVDPAGWEFRWCASVVPADATCFAPGGRTILENIRYRDLVGLPKDPCPVPGAKPPTQPSGTTPTGSTGGNVDDDDAGAFEDEKGAPGVGLVGLIAVGALAASAFRRRG